MFVEKPKHMSKGFTAEQMMPLVEAWQQSGQSKKQFCSEQNISYQIFIYWCRKLIEEKNHTSSFIPVTVKKTVEENSGKSHAEVIFPSGAKVIFNEPVEASFLRNLLF